MTKRASPNAVFFFCITLLVLNLAAFFQVKDFKFLNHDDPFFVTANPYVQSGLTLNGIRWAFTADLLHDSIYADYWHPIVFLSHMMDVQIFGMNAAMHHSINFFLHLLNCILVFLFFKKLTGNFWRSAFLSIFFAIHPLQAETVSWVSARKDLLSGFFGLLTLNTYVILNEMKDSPSRILRRCLRITVILFYFFSLMSKPAWIFLPFILILLDYIAVHKLNFRNSLDGKIPFFLLSFLSVLIILFGKSEAAVDAANHLTGYDIASILNVPNQYLSYFWKAIFPFHPSVYPEMPAQEFQVISILMSLGIILLISLFLFQKRKKLKMAFFGWIWFLLLLAPSILLLPANRFMYMPVIGILALVILRVKPEEPGNSRSFTSFRMTEILFGVLFIFTFTYLSHIRTSEWKDSLTRFSKSVEREPYNTRARFLLASSLAETNKTLEEALKEFRLSVENHPTDAQIYLRMGDLFVKQHKFDHAIRHFEKAMELLPNQMIKRVALNNIGFVKSEEKKYEEASYYYQKTLEADPNYVETYFNLANLKLHNKKPEEAVLYYRKALAIEPRYDQARNELATTLMRLGEIQESKKEFETLIHLNPKHAEGHNNLGVILYSMGKKEEARAHFARALKINPNYESAKKNLNQLLA